MPPVTEQQILDALAQVQDPEQRGSIVALGMVQGLVVRDGHVTFAIEIDPARAESFEPVRKAAERAVHVLPGVLTVTAVLTAERAAQSAGQGPSGPAARPQGPHGHAGARGPGGTPPGGGQLRLDGVRAIIAVASGKGGVGKSTTAANLALALSSLGLSVGLFDADIFGPSMPRMMGLRGRRPSSPDGKRIIPLQAHGLKVMSIGFMVEEDTPVIWRGPMVMGALEQMLGDVNWAPLDVLVVDMPPGTGDAQLTMSQRVPLTGAVIVSTPQDIALLDARKGLNMFRKVNVPVFGIIENMSYYICPKCGHRDEIFSHGGAKATAGELDTDFLGEIPLDIKIRETADGGNPIVVSDPDSPHAQAYVAIARKVHDKIEAVLSGEAHAPPRIVVE